MHGLNLQAANEITDGTCPAIYCFPLPKRDSVGGKKLYTYRYSSDNAWFSIMLTGEKV
jgi:hypothetical protein